jgi:hypothetical protein
MEEFKDRLETSHLSCTTADASASLGSSSILKKRSLSSSSASRLSFGRREANEMKKLQRDMDVEVYSMIFTREKILRAVSTEVKLGLTTNGLVNMSFLRLLKQLRETTVCVIESIMSWTETLVEYKPLQWKGWDYVLKLQVMNVLNMKLLHY